MSQAIIVAFITGGLSLLGTILTILQTSKKTEESFKIHQAVTDEKIENLTREVRKHNGFAERLPVLEQRVSDLAEQVKASKS
jgi:hypothetical protein